ncbi:hypothetical protein U0030_11395 [Brevundimonas bullata]|uniref:hypothetical protein n=1 Tax=Brevundimonas bullata TaxID=13160 RepID=UPI000E0B7ACC|nr:hypothetical protein [Brevundimonas bullata]WQE35878.1 hypothetical protein U0030_11395 [Brevundimonas bullata]
MTLALLILNLLAAPQPTTEHRLVLTGVGRFAIFADVASVMPDADGVRMRSLQISEEDIVIGDAAYVGGWSWWRFDCAAQTADRLDFASLKADGTEGPITPTKSAPYVIAPGGDAAELAAVACGADARAIDAVSTAEAVRIGRERMQD